MGLAGETKIKQKFSSDRLARIENARHVSKRPIKNKFLTYGISQVNVNLGLQEFKNAVSKSVLCINIKGRCKGSRTDIDKKTYLSLKKIYAPGF